VIIGNESETCINAAMFAAACGLRLHAFDNDPSHRAAAFRTVSGKINVHCLKI